MGNRVLIYTENYARGGGNRYMLDLLAAVGSKFDESVIVSNKKGVYPEEATTLIGMADLIEINIATKIPLQFKLRLLAEKNWILRKLLGFFLLCIEPFIVTYNGVLFASLILRLKPNRILVCNGGYPGATSCMVMVVVSKLLGIKTHMSVVSIPTPRRKYLYKFEKMIDFLVWKSCDRVITNCDAISHSLISIRGLPAFKTNTVFNGVTDVLDYVPKTYSADCIKRKLVIGFVSRLEESKGVFVLLEAFLHLQESDQEFELRYYGAGSAHQELLTIIESQNLGGKVFLRGHYFGDISEIMEEIDIYISPSFWEGLPYGLLEAMRSGVAIIATDVGGTMEAIENLVSGIIIPPRSAPSIQAAIERVVNEPNLLSKLGSNARLAFLDKFELSKSQENARMVFFNEV